MTKEELRKVIKKRASTFSYFTESSAAICDKIINSPQFQSASVILAYMALPDEADLTEVLHSALAQRKRIYIPKINPEDSTMEFYQYTGETEKGPFNIQQPVSTDKSKLFCPETELEPTLVLVPGLAFTKNGKRMGRGKGYYDKYLTRLNKQAGIAGVCLQFQLVGDLPADEHDIRMDFIFQE